MEKARGTFRAVKLSLFSLQHLYFMLMQSLILDICTQLLLLIHQLDFTA